MQSKKRQKSFTDSSIWASESPKAKANVGHKPLKAASYTVRRRERGSRRRREEECVEVEVVL